jgi:dienelactone hydrolase
MGLGLALVGPAATTHAADIGASETPAALAEHLIPHMRIHRPEGEGPFPTVLQFHGCGSQYAAQDDWAAFLAENGIQAIVVDSLGPRGIGRTGAITTVCLGLRLRGQERAGDVLAALHAVQDMDDVDTDNLFLAGWSHGGWTLMDLFTLDLGNTTPADLDEVDAEALTTVRGALLIYPYCGILTDSRTEDWHAQIDTLMVTGGRDTVAPAESCERIADRLVAAGHEIDHMHFDNVTHAFDVATTEPFQRGEYDQARTEEARDAALEFFRERMTSP